MSERVGVCQQCNARFKIPATFTANKAKCSKCGGVVEIGPVTSEAAAPAIRDAEPSRRPARKEHRAPRTSA